MASTLASGLVFGLVASVHGLQLLPPQVQKDDAFVASVWEIESGPKTIYIEEDIASTTDTDGLTLIPPSGYDFAELFQEDLSQLTGHEWTLERVEKLPQASNTSGIFLGQFSGDASSVTYEDGQRTTEGYQMHVNSTGAFIGGTGARGLWWGTRTLLQQLLLSNGSSIPAGNSIDMPAYATRGFMLDAGRKWYKPSLLKELCSYASFFKMNEFHYHLSDNYPLNRGKNETWTEVYSHFSLLPEDESLLGIIHGRENETLTREDFADLQKHCAARGVTVIPEIEAPGHCLYLTKWMPELALPKQDLLNLSHPDTIPTVKRIWDEFLPWFETKEVHVGADEYDPELADVYIGFVNEMSQHINSTADKRIRIWGTHEPSENLTISKDVVIQHWQYGQSDPVQLAADGYDVINSEDWWAYTSIKNDHMPILPAKYPQFFNESRVLNFANEEGWQWSPRDYNPFNKTMQLSAEEERNRGAIMAAWNDNGPDASTQLEAYYSMRRGIALVGARAWSGTRGPELEEEGVSSTIDFFSPLAPGQNLDRTLPAKEEESGPLVSWTRSGDDGETVELGHGSKGMNYTLSLSASGPFTLSGMDNTLSLDEDGKLVFDSDGWLYPLRSVAENDAMELDPGHPGRIWVNVSSSSHEEVTISTEDKAADIVIATDVLHGSVVWVNGEFVGRFEVYVYGGRNTQFSWSQMAMVAPLEKISGSGLESLKVEDGFKTQSGDGGDGGQGNPPPVPENAAAGPSVSWMVVSGVVMGFVALQM
jgi:hexosaminidase